MKVNVVCQVAGTGLFEVAMAYSTDCPLTGAATAVIVMLLTVGVPETAGIPTSAPAALLITSVIGAEII